MEARPEMRARIAVAVAAVMSLAAAVLFLGAFRLSKIDAIQAISPFAGDPPDAVASIGVQVALAGALIAAIRWARLAGDPEFVSWRARLVLPGCYLVTASIGLTVLVDVVSLSGSALWVGSPWAAVLIGGLAALGALGAASGIATWIASLRLEDFPREALGGDRHTLADLVDDSLVVSERLGVWIGRLFPPLGRMIDAAIGLIRRLWGWLDHSWISPRAHPWRFAIGVGLLCGIGLLAAKVVLEGQAPNAATQLLIVAIYLGVELAAVLGGYLILGGWLGIRPPLGRHA